MDFLLQGPGCIAAEGGGMPIHNTDDKDERDKTLTYSETLQPIDEKGMGRTNGVEDGKIGKCHWVTKGI